MSALTTLDTAAVPSGTNVLVTGPPMTGKRRVLFSLVADSDAAERGSVLISTRLDVERTRRAFQRVAGDVDDDLVGVVDCTGTDHLSGRSASTQNGRRVSSPGDLTGIGIAATEFLRRFRQQRGRARLGLHSLSTMLMYADLRRVFQFLHVLTGRIASSGFVGGVAADDALLDERERALVHQLFDARIELRETEDGEREIRVRGGDFGPSAWTPFVE